MGMRAYANDLRCAIVKADERQGYSQRQRARVFDVSVATVRN